MKHEADNAKRIFTPKTKVGLGDAAEVVFKPIAKALGKTGCASCRRRKASWNKVLPNINPFA